MGFVLLCTIPIHAATTSEQVPCVNKERVPSSLLKLFETFQSPVSCSSIITPKFAFVCPP